jgi:hypothetical protein
MVQGKIMWFRNKSIQKVNEIKLIRSEKNYKGTNLKMELVLEEFLSRNQLMMVAGNGNQFTAPIATGVLRKKGSAVINLPADPENFKSIWLFFRTYRKDAFSWDQWFGI